MDCVERASSRDLEVIVGTLANAFALDPLLLWVLGQPRDAETRLRSFFSATIAAELRRVDHGVFRNTDGSSAAVWQRHPSAMSSSRWAMIRQLPALVGALRSGVRRAMQAASATAAIHPAEPHYYLEILGTREEDQGRGYGAMMLRQLLASCDAAGLGAYLETANPRTISFYNRFGFMSRERVPLPAGAPEVFGMWRSPAP